jgi:hypothetical protein
MQTKKHSLIEAMANTATGFIISIITTPFVFYICGIKYTGFQLGLLTVIMTIISILRSYLVRIYFNKKRFNIKKMNKIEDFVQVVTTFEYKVFDQPHTGFMYDSKPQQIADLIRGGIHGTAEFTKMTEFHVKTGDVIYVNLKQIVRNYEEGSSNDPAVIRKKKERELKDFKDKNKHILE